MFDQILFRVGNNCYLSFLYRSCSDLAIVVREDDIIGYHLFDNVPHGHREMLLILFRDIAIVHTLFSPSEIKISAGVAPCESL